MEYCTDLAHQTAIDQIVSEKVHTRTSGRLWDIGNISLIWLLAFFSNKPRQ